MRTIAGLGFMTSLFVLSITLLLALSGEISYADAPILSSILTDVALDDPTSEEFKTDLLPKDSSGNFLNNPASNSFATIDLSFLQDIPLLGNILSFFSFIYALIFEGPAAVVSILQRVGVPPIIYAAIGGLMKAVYLITLFSFILDFIAARGSRTL